MKSPQRVLIILPTYNEAENILNILRQLTASAPQAHILVVDDSSPDGTADLVRSFLAQNESVFLLTRPQKEGLAQAYFSGFHWGLKKDYEVLMQMDADLSHSPAAVPAFIERIAVADVVLGTRYIAGGGVSGWPWIRQAISRGGNIYAKTILRVSYSDLTGGFNAWRAEVLRKIEPWTITSRGYAFQVEMKYRAHKAGFKIEEIPIHFENRRFGTSKMSGNIVFEAALKVFQMNQILA